jgi:hypothetical protein
MEKDGRDYGNCDRGVQNQGINQEAAKTEIVCTGERRIGGVCGHYY